MANLATRAGVEGTQRLTIHAPLLQLTKADIIAAGTRARRGLRADDELLRSRARRHRLRALRCLPAAPQGIRGGGHAGSDRLRDEPRRRGVTYTVKEIFYTLQGEGVNAGRPAVFCRFAGCNLWTRARGRPRHRRLPVLRHRLRGCRSRRRHASRRRRRWPRPCAAAGPPMRRERCDRSWCAPAASRCCSSTRRRSTRCTRRLRDRGGDQRHHRRPRWHRLAVREPQGRCHARAAGRRRAQARVSAGGPGRRPAALRRDGASATSCCSPWTDRDRAENTAAAIAYCLAHPQWRLSVQTHKDIGVR